MGGLLSAATAVLIVDSEIRDAANPLSAGLLLDLGWSPFGDDCALIDDCDAIRQRIRLFQIVRGEQYCLASLHQVANFIPERAPGFHIEPDRRLVEEKQIRIAADGERKQHALSLSAREVPKLAIDKLLEARGCQHLFQRQRF